MSEMENNTRTSGPNVSLAEPRPSYESAPSDGIEVLVPLILTVKYGDGRLPKNVYSIIRGGDYRPQFPQSRRPLGAYALRGDVSQHALVWMTGGALQPIGPSD